MFRAIVAVDEDYGIGTIALDGDGKPVYSIPWKCPADMKMFRETTKGGVVIMGSNTYKSIGKSLSGRTNIILTRQKKSPELRPVIINPTEWKEGTEVPNVTINVHCSTVEQVLAYIEEKKIDPNMVWVIGGAQIYALFAPLIREYRVSWIPGKHNCTITMPRNFVDGFSPEGTQTLPMGDGTDQEFMICTYKRIDSTEAPYLDLMDRIVQTGSVVLPHNDRTGVGYKEVVGPSLKFDISQTIPLMTTRKIMWRGIVEELLWFLRGSTNSKELETKGINIWRKNTTKSFIKGRNLPYQEGDAGPIYGYQWRSWNKPYGRKRGTSWMDSESFGKFTWLAIIVNIAACVAFGIVQTPRFAIPTLLSIVVGYVFYQLFIAEAESEGLDQLGRVIRDIRNLATRYGRRHIISSWNPEQIDQMVLPPCHVLYQFIVTGDDVLHVVFYQRSSDVWLACCWNVVSASVLTYIIAHQTGLKPGTVTMHIGDAHVYNNHQAQVAEQLARQKDARGFPTLKIRDRGQDINSYTYEDFELIGYYPLPAIQGVMNA